MKTGPRTTTLIRGGAALAIGAAAGLLFSALKTPIPWMLGPLFAVALLRVSGVPVAAPDGSRQIGQWIIGTALGLYFTPPVVDEVGRLWPLLLAGAAFAIFVGYCAGVALARLGGLDRTTAIFASVPGGAAEMATLGERFGARVDRVAAAQSLRITIVVTLIPALYAVLQWHGADPYAPGTTAFVPTGFAELIALTLIGGFIARAIDVPNPFVLGALAIAIPLTAFRVDLSAVPQSASNAAQCLLGCALGSRFERDFLRGAHRFVGAVMVTVLLSIVLSAAFGLLLAWWTGLPAATLVLGTAPGGVAEMSITAKVLQLGVPVVTALHVTRVVVLLLSTAPIFAWARAQRAKRS
jgi:membrane AbrB-like protein